MDKDTILQNITKTFQSVMDFFNAHEGQMDTMVCDLEKEQSEKDTIPEEPSHEQK